MCERAQVCASSVMERTVSGAAATSNSLVSFPRLIALIIAIIVCALYVCVLLLVCSVLMSCSHPSSHSEMSQGGKVSRPPHSTAEGTTSRMKGETSAHHRGVGCE